MQLNDLVVLPIALLLVGAGLQGLLARLLPGKAKGWMAFLFGLAALACIAMLLPTTARGQVLDVRLAIWDAPIRLAFHVDGLSELFALMGSAIGSAVLLYSIDYMSHDESATRFYIILQVFIAGLVTLVFVSDLLLLYAAWELVGLCSFLLVGFWYTQREAAAGARKVLVMTHITGYALLAAILVLFARTGTTAWTDPKVAHAFTTGLFVLMLIAALAKSVQYPLHTWIPFAMAAPTPVSALLHSACYVTAGVYLVARMHSFVAWPAAWQATVVWIGTATMVIGILFAMIQHDAKRMLAFSTVSQIGYMMLGLGLGTPLGIVAGLLHCLNHGVFKGALFLGAGAVQHATGTRDMRKLGGLGRRMPITAALWFISAGAIAGVPLLSGFVSKWLIYVAALKAGYAAPAIIAWFVSVMTMFTLMKATNGIFLGEDGEASSKAHESPKSMLVGMGILAAGSIFLGVMPQVAIDYAVAPALGSMGMHLAVGTSWLGITTNAGSWYTVTGLVLALAALIAGGLVYWFATHRRVRVPARIAPTGMAMALAPQGPAPAALPPIGVVTAASLSGTAFSGGMPLPRGAKLTPDDFTAPVRRGLAPFFEWVDPDRYYLAIWHATLALAAKAQQMGSWLEQRAVAALGVFAAVIALVAFLFAQPVRVASEKALSTGDSRALVISVGLALVCLLLAMLGSRDLRKHAWLALIGGGLVMTALLVDQEMVRLAALEAAAFVAFALLAMSGVERKARGAYLAAVVVSAVLLVAGTLLLETGPAALVLALFLGGFAVKLALVPAYLWLPKMAERTPAPLVGLIIAVVDVAAFAELISLRATAGWLFAPVWPWLVLALLSAVGGAGLGLAQKDVKRFLTFSTVTDAGFLTLGIALAGPFGLAGATAGAAAHALAKGLLFTSVGAAEVDGPVTLASHGIARRHPLASAGFVAGAIAALGVPPTAGYLGHWRLYATALAASPWFLALLIIATALSVLAYARVIALTWWGGEDAESGHEAPRHQWRTIWSSEPAPLVIAMVVLMIAVLAAGVWPRIL